MSRRVPALLLTEKGEVLHDAAPAYGLRLSLASNAAVRTCCGLTAWPARGSVARSLPKCKRCFPAEGQRA